MSNPTRYNPRARGSGCSDMMESPSGEWLRFFHYAKLENRARAVADDLEDEVRARYGCAEPGTVPAGAIMHRYVRDMESVRELRDLIGGNDGEE